MFLKLEIIKNILKKLLTLTACLLLIFTSFFLVWPALAANDCGTFAGTTGYTCQNTTTRTGGTASCVTGHCSGTAVVQCCPTASASDTDGGATPAADKYGLGEAADKTGLSNTALSARVSTFIGAIVGFVGVIFLVLMIYGGLTWMTAGGNEEKVGKAKKIIVNSTIGIIIVMLSYAITYYIITTVAKAG